MTDRPLDETDFERALRATLEDLAPGTTPAALRAAVAAVPRRRRRGLAARGRPLFAVIGVAAALVMAVAGLGLVAGLRLPDGGLSPVGSPPPASPTPGPTMLTFQVVPANGSTATKAQVEAVGDLLAARLRAYGIGTFSWSASDDRLTFEVDEPLDAASRATIRSLLGSTGSFSIGQPVATPPAVGERVSGPPLLTAEAIQGSGVGTDQLGNPTLDLTLTAQAATVFADATSAHVGDYLPIALDGVAIAVPVIKAPIPDGQLQVAFSSDDTTSAARLAAILQAGPLPLPVEPVAP
jgi:SecDF, P1 head subdomain